MSLPSKTSQFDVQLVGAARIRRSVCEPVRMAAFFLMLLAALEAFCAAPAHAQTLLENIDLGINTFPVAIAVNPVTHKVYTANYFANSVSVIDGNTLAVQTISGIAQPSCIGVDPVANKIYVGAQSSASVVVIDGATNAATQISLGQAFEKIPAAIAVDPLRGLAYVVAVSAFSETGELWLINGTTASEVALQSSGGLNPPGNDDVVVTSNGAGENLILASNSNALSLNPYQSLVYLSEFSNTKIFPADQTNPSPQSVAVGSFPVASAVNPATNTIYVANHLDNTVTVIDGTTLTATTLAVGEEPISIAVNPVTNLVYVVNFGSNNVTVIDGATNTTSTIPVGESPFSVAVNPVNNRIYVANNGEDLTVIDGATGAATPITVGAHPFSIAADPVTNRIYVAVANSNQVSVIDGSTNAVTTVAAGTRPAASP